ncbi:hypothetical protein [Novosphingobium sp. BW1]|uniref:hypothetical protein n=1 Tax=Novosphingobium sp. BW1 TaxID=2592621 RepID=UPI0011DEA84C|nr:hypothetical protein [Novosphingobium sp. BW1]TYC93026.1 hypothetical protein FMM79_03300 [Novosphingobium sp. BW1]
MKRSTTIQELGGAKVVADALRSRGVPVAEVTVRSWSLSGRTIPAKYWLHIADIARTQGLELSLEALAKDAAA